MAARVVEKIDIVNYVAGAAVAGYGSYGYVKKNSIPSIAAGLSLGSLLVGAGYLSHSQPKKTLGPLIAFAVATILGAYSVNKIVRSPSVSCCSPPTVVATGSVLVALLNFLAWRLRSSQ